MLEQFVGTGVIYFSIDFGDGEYLVDAYAVVTADVEYEAASNDCPSSCSYKINPEFTVHYERNAEEIDPTLLQNYEYIISTYVYDGSRCHWDNKTYKDISKLIEENQLSIDWD